MNSEIKLPQAIVEDRPKLSPEGQKELKALSRRRPIRFIGEAVFAWVTIFAAIWLAVEAQSVLVSVLVMIFVASRQNLLALLVHDQAHCTSLKPWPGDLVTNLLCAYPLLVLTVEGYAQVHLTHHKRFFQEEDPDFKRKHGDDWRIPIEPRRLAVLFLRDLLMLNVINLVKGKQMSADTTYKRPNPTPTWVRMLFYAVAISTLTLTSSWSFFLLYWLLPLLTFFQVWVRWGALCEHEYNHLGANVAETSPIIRLKWYDKLLMPNLNFTLHPYHHYHPGIGFYNLPKVHELYVRESLVDESKVFDGYWSYLKFIVGKTPQATSSP